MAPSNLPLVSDRNRLEINFTNGNSYWRYRNKLALQKTIAVRSYHPALLANAESYYNSRYHKRSDTTVYAGCIFPSGNRTQINPYYEHENSTGASSKKWFWTGPQSLLPSR